MTNGYYTLSDYIAQVQLLVRDLNQVQFNQQQIIEKINEARKFVSGDTKCVTVRLVFGLTVNKIYYKATDILFSSPQYDDTQYQIGTNNVYVPQFDQNGNLIPSSLPQVPTQTVGDGIVQYRDMWCYINNFRNPVSLVPYGVLNYTFLTFPYSNFPFVVSIINQANDIVIQPYPTLGYPFGVLADLYAAPLTSLTQVDWIPQPWSNLVQYYAAYLLNFLLQREDLALRMEALYYKMKRDMGGFRQQYSF